MPGGLGLQQLRDDDDKEGSGGLTAPRSSVIRLEDTTKGVQRGDRVLAVFPDTTSFYLGMVHKVRIGRDGNCGMRGVTSLRRFVRVDEYKNFLKPRREHPGK